MLGFLPRLWPTIIAVPIVLTCLGLGAWQVQRMEWKRGLIAEREAALALPAAAAPLTLDDARRMEFRHVTDEGVFLHDRKFLSAPAPARGGSGITC